MPPGADAFIAALLNTILSQYGALVSVLLVIIWYLTKSLADERRAHVQTTAKFIEFVQKSLESDAKTADAMQSLRNVVEISLHARQGRRALEP